MERCEEHSAQSLWFSAVNSNDVSSVGHLIQQQAEVNAQQFTVERHFLVTVVHLLVTVNLNNTTQYI